MITKTKQSTFPDQAKLKVMSDRLCDNIEELLDILDVEDYKISDKMVICSCPIHGGDNDSAFNLYHTGDSYRGNWKCRTHGCEETFKSSILGFIRGCLSKKRFDWPNNTDQICTFKETITFAEQFLGDKLDNIKINNKDKEKSIFVNAVKYISNNKPDESKKISRASIVNSLEIPSKYFVSRGFSKNILTKYDVGDCTKTGKPMSGRAVVPVYDNNRQYMIGCTGRATTDKCEKCNHYHLSNECPDKESLYLYCKWRHNYGFKTQNYLYNYWFAQEHIKESRSVILVESPGNVWRLEEAGIHNSVAIFGSSLADIQKMILDTSGAMTIYTIMDNDDAGKKAAENVHKKCERTYNIVNIQIDYPDVAAMTVEQIQDFIKPRLEYV
jgi:hypothetical protein